VPITPVPHIKKQNINTNSICMETQYPQRRHRRPDKEQDQFLPIRNILNIIFIIGAIIGVSVYFLSDTTVGTFIVLGSMVFKIAETILRFIR
jgi:hypothetical protein